MSKALQEKIQENKSMANKVNPVVDNSLVGQIVSYTPAYKSAMNADDGVTERFVRVLKTLVASNTNLQKCSPQSIIGAALQVAEAKYELSLKHCYIIPYWNSFKRCFEASFQIGLAGAEELFYRANPNALLDAHVVYSCDEFVYQLGLEPKLHHVPYKYQDVDPNALPVPKFVYAIAFYPNGQKQFKVMTWDEILQIRDTYSKSYIHAKDKTNTVWYKSPGEMAQNTVIKRLLKHTRKSIEMAQILASDYSVKYAPPMSQIEQMGGAFKMLEAPGEPEYIASQIESDQTPAKQDKPTPVAKPKVQTPTKAKTAPKKKQEDIEDIEDADVSDDSFENMEAPVKADKATPKPIPAPKPEPDDKGELPMTDEEGIMLYLENIKKAYIQLRTMYPKKYDSEGIKACNMKHVGTPSAKTCKDTEKLDSLLVFLQQEIAEDEDLL